MKQPNGKIHSGAAIPNQHLQQPHKLAPAAPVVEGESPLCYQMPEELHQELLALNARAQQLKITLADKLLELRGIEQITLQANAEVGARITGFVRAHGIDPNNPELGRWNFDIQAGTLTKIG